MSSEVKDRLASGTYREIKDRLESGRWIKDALPDLTEQQILKISICFQETYSLMLESEEAERAEEEAARHRVVEDVRARGCSPEVVAEWRDLGWRITKRATKVTNTEAFLANHGQSVPADALSVIKSKLPTHLKKEIRDYEQITGHTITAKRRVGEG